MIPNQQAHEMAAALFRRLTLNADGQPFDDSDPGTWDAADSTAPETVSLSGVHFRIVDPDAADLAIAVGALNEGGSLVCLRVAFTPAETGGAVPQMGDIVALPADEGVSVLFEVIIGHADLHDPSAHDLGPSAVRNEALDVLQPGEVLLVQVLNTPEVAE
ncbi:MAG: hypothetical protein ACREXG_00925 [Polaromonas sp.]